ncbi:hypothetical protein PCE1_000430 [Barthelona sp. PCE]
MKLQRIFSRIPDEGKREEINERVIEKYLEERRRNFPSEENIKRKKRLQTLHENEDGGYITVELTDKDVVKNAKQSLTTTKKKGKRKAKIRTSQPKLKAHGHLFRLLIKDEFEREGRALLQAFKYFIDNGAV